MSVAQQGNDALVIAMSKKITLGGGATAAVSGSLSTTSAGHALTAASGIDITGVCAMIGAGVAVLGFFVSVYFQWRRDRRESRESNWRMGDPDRRSND